MFGSFTRGERNILLGLFAMLTVGTAYQQLALAPSRVSVAKAPTVQQKSHQQQAGVSAVAGVGGWKPKALGENAETSGSELSAGLLARLPDGRLDLNRATVRHLTELPGIGPSRAEDILEYRQRAGGFTSVEQLDDVKGIGVATLDRLRPLVAVGVSTGTVAATAGAGRTEVAGAAVDGTFTGTAIASEGPRGSGVGVVDTAGNGVGVGRSPVVAAQAVPQVSPQIVRPHPTIAAAPPPWTPINLNTASVQELEQLSGIGPALARRIVEYRSQRGPFRTVDSLIEVKGIGQKIMERNRTRITVR